MKKKALVAGGSGVIGGNLVRYLEQQPDWEVIGLSRHETESASSLSVDLLDETSVIEKLSVAANDVTHIFHAAYQERDTPQALIDTNLTMLKNVVNVVSQHSSVLQRVVLYQGAKYYGAHLGEFKTPAKEDDARHMPPDFYYDMQDWLLEKTRNQSWGAVILRPDVVCGFSVGNPMNLAMVIAVYATISKYLGMPLRFPGTKTCYTKLAQVTDATQLAKGSVWAATEGKSGEAYNLTNGDIFRWEQLWHKIAAWFDMPVAEPQTISLTEYMADKGPLWKKIVQQYQLVDIPYQKLAAWGFGDFILRCDWDVISSTTKIRQAGFHDCVDSTDMFIHLFDDFRKRGLIL